MVQFSSCVCGQDKLRTISTSISIFFGVYFNFNSKLVFTPRVTIDLGAEFNRKWHRAGVRTKHALKLRSLPTIIASIPHRESAQLEQNAFTLSNRKASVLDDLRSPQMRKLIIICPKTKYAKA